MKVIEYQRKDDSQEYSLRMKTFKSFKKFYLYTLEIMKYCQDNNIHANYYRVENKRIVKILYISNKGLYCTL